MSRLPGDDAKGGGRPSRPAIRRAPAGPRPASPRAGGPRRPRGQRRRPRDADRLAARPALPGCRFPPHAGVGPVRRGPPDLERVRRLRLGVRPDPGRGAGSRPADLHLGVRRGDQLPRPRLRRSPGPVSLRGTVRYAGVAFLGDGRPGAGIRGVPRERRDPLRRRLGRRTAPPVRRGYRAAQHDRPDRGSRRSWGGSTSRAGSSSPRGAFPPRWRRRRVPSGSP